MRAVLLCGLIALFACSQVGREIVGERAPHDGTPSCPMARQCGALEVEPPEGVPEPAVPVALSDCTFRPPVNCPASSAPISGAGVSACSDDASNAVEVALPWQGGLSSLSCGMARLTPPQDGDLGAALQAEGSVLRQVTLRIASSSAVSVELRHAYLVHVSFELRGPVSVRLIDSERMEDVRVIAGGPAQFAIEGGHATQLAIAAPSGSVIMRRATAKGMRALLARLEFESVQLEAGVLEAERFDAADSTLSQLEVHARRVLLSASTVDMSSFAECEAFSGIAGGFQSTLISACREPHRLYGATFNLSRIDGAMILDRASVSLTELGVTHAEPAEVWDSMLAGVSFCGDQQAYAFGGRSNISCARCDLADAPVDLDVCIGEQAELSLEHCEACPSLDASTGCAGDRPRRMRPPL